MYEIQNAARRFYADRLPIIMNHRADDWALDPYEWDGSGIVLSPIESWLWTDIRQANMILYPQMPVAGFFADFGNPVAKVAIECDGAAFHNPERDAARASKIKQSGWTLYRFTGKECRMDTYDEFEGDPWRERLHCSATFRRIQTIGEKHRIVRGCLGNIPEGPRPIQSLADQLIDKLMAYAR
jgi:hypothetical protein